MNAIEVKSLTKRYGSIEAVVNFSFSVKGGELVAVAGPDGAGKTSLFRSMCGLIEFDEGQILLLDHDVTADLERIKPDLGYMPQTFSLYPDLSVEENLAFYAGLFGLSRADFRERKQRLYQFSGLGPFAGRRAQNLSGGMKQKLALSCNLIHNPKVLILDEPTTGVDPLSRRQFWDIIVSLRREGSSVVVSTPYMDEVARADRAVFMNEGRKLTEGTPEELIAKYEGKTFTMAAQATSKEMKSLELGGIRAGRFGSSLHVYAGEDVTAADLARKLEALGVETQGLQETQPGLEDVFIQLMDKATAEVRADG